jgi:hypothetical protein
MAFSKPMLSHRLSITFDNLINHYEFEEKKTTDSGVPVLKDSHCVENKQS